MPTKAVGHPGGNGGMVKDRNRAAHCCPYRERTEEAEMSDNERREIIFPPEAEKFAMERNREFYDAVVSCAVKPGGGQPFAVNYLIKPTQEDKDCYDCQYCSRHSYIKGEWPCAKFAPDEAPEDYTCFCKRENKPSCSDCKSWEGSGDYRCFCLGSSWEGKTTSADNYCRFFDRRAT